MSTWKLEPVSNPTRPPRFGDLGKKKGVGTRIAKSEEPNSQTHTQRTPNLIK
jgi:hypothetical protein